jgi:hypothetical protein
VTTPYAAPTYCPPSYLPPELAGSPPPAAPSGTPGPYAAPGYYPTSYLPAELVGGGADVAGPLPYGLASAVEARCLALASTTLAGLGGFYKDQAGGNAETPYLVFSVARGMVAIRTSDSTWHDVKITLKCWADSGEEAESLAEAARAAFEGLSLSFRTGVTTRLVESAPSQGKGPGRKKGATNAYWSAVEFQARTRTGVPGG